MLQIGPFHPQIVHFVIALLAAGVIMRLIWLTGRFRFTNEAAVTLIVVGTLAATLAVWSGDQAHGVAERIPGARDAVVTHEEWGQRTRNLFFIVVALEAITLLLGRDERRAKPTRIAGMASGILGLVGLVFLYQTGQKGGDIVYEYAGGVGTRHGRPEDVQRLLVAGLYHNAMQDREAGRHEDAARLIDELARRNPNDPTIRLLVIESTLRDRKDAAAALGALNGFAAGDDARLGAQAGLLRVDAHLAAGQRDSAVATLQQLQKMYPQNARIQARADTMGVAAPAAPSATPPVTPPADSLTTTTR